VKLQEEFIGEKEKLKKRARETEEIALNCEMQVKYLDLVQTEANEMAARIEQQKQHSFEKLTAAYCQKMQMEADEAGKLNGTLMCEYVKIMCDNEEMLRVAPL
jgi:hypothetical protein